MTEATGLLGKRVNHAALQLLTEAVTSIYWFKDDLERFIRRCVREPEVVSRLTFSDSKRVVATELVDLLAASQDRYLTTLLELMAEVSSFDDFSHLARLDDGKAKVEHAKQTVAALKKQYEVHSELVAEKAAVEARRAQARAQAGQRQV